MAVLKSIGIATLGGYPTTLLPILTNLNVCNLKNFSQFKNKNEEV